MITAVKERPILFSGEMVRAILEGRKTQTRRALGHQPCEEEDVATCHESPGHVYFSANGRGTCDFDCPYGRPGDRLWVRETWADVNSEAGPSILYRADGGMQSWHDFSESFGPNFGAGPSMDYDAYPGDYCMWWSDLWRGEPGHKWRASIYMPRWASRITLEVTDIRAERLQEISEKDARSEGVTAPNMEYDQSWGPTYNQLPSYRDSFRKLWDSINAKRGYSWESNPWVWAISFRRLEGNQ